MTAEVARGQDRARQIQWVLVVTLALNILAGLAMLLPAWTSGSLSLLAGALDAAFDSAANVLGIWVVRAASRPPDETHPYGHRKFETMVAVVIAAVMLVTCGQIAWSALQRLVGDGRAVVVDSLVLAAPLAAIAASSLATAYETRRGRELESELLIADAGHTLAHAGVASALLLGLLAVRAGYSVVDPLLALSIAAVIAWTGLGIAQSTLDVLADARALDPADVREVATRVPGVIGVHKVRSRGPKSAIAVDLHVQVDPTLGIEDGHAISHRVQDELQRELPGVVDVVVHVEPEASLVDGEIVRGPVDIAPELRPIVAEAVDSVDGLSEAHAVEAVQVAGELRLSLRVHADGLASLAEVHAMAQNLEANLRSAVPDLLRVTIQVEPELLDPERFSSAEGPSG